MTEPIATCEHRAQHLPRSGHEQPNHGRRKRRQLLPVKSAQKRRGQPTQRLVGSHQCVVLRKMLEDCERRAATAERDLVIERARRAQAERHASDLAEGLPRSRLVPLGPPTDPEAIESAHLAAGADDCASHSRPPERALRPVRGRGKRMRDAVPDVPREEGEGAPV